MKNPSLQLLPLNRCYYLFTGKDASSGTGEFPLTSRERKSKSTMPAQFCCWVQTRKQYHSVNLIPCIDSVVVDAVAGLSWKYTAFKYWTGRDIRVVPGECAFGTDVRCSGHTLMGGEKSPFSIINQFSILLNKKQQPSRQKGCTENMKTTGKTVGL